VPTTVQKALRAGVLRPAGCVRWGVRVPETKAGVYIVATSNEIRSTERAIAVCPIDPKAVGLVLKTRPELLLDGRRPTVEALAERIASFWLPDEVILYIGLAGTSLQTRVNQYYRTPLGARKPHAGGWFLKVLSNLDDLWVHYAPCDDPRDAEDKMHSAFCRGVSMGSIRRLSDPEHPFPFANLEWPPGVRKRHGIAGAKGELVVRPTVRAAREPVIRTKVVRRSDRPGSQAHVEAINAHIQQQLRVRGQESATAVEAAKWLDEAGVLTDSMHRVGLPLRNFLRKGVIGGQRQEPNGRWFIDRQS
jgi:hypothetical protein